MGSKGGGVPFESPFRSEIDPRWKGKVGCGHIQDVSRRGTDQCDMAMASHVANTTAMAGRARRCRSAETCVRRRTCARRAVHAKAAAEGGQVPPNTNWKGIALAAGAAAATATAAAAFTHAPLMDFVRSTGFTAALALIFVSEVGDKTFFIAALLAMKRGAAAVLAGSMLSLGAMTAISVVIGRVLKGVPDSIHLTVPIGEYLAVALLVFFGLKSINEALKMPGPFMGAQEEVTDEWKEAEKEVEDSETKTTVPKTFWATMVKTAGLIFVAEWGDRSMLATIALGAAQNPVGVFTGAFIGHLVATAIAVGGGAFLSKWVNEKLISLTGGILFLLFAVATVVGVF